jgi:hypothetical protein
MKRFHALSLRRAARTSRRFAASNLKSSARLWIEPVEPRVFLSGTLPGLSGAAAYDETSNTVTFSGAATLTLDPGANAPLFVGAGPDAVLTLDAGANTPLHLGGLHLSNGAKASAGASGTGPSSSARRVLVVDDGAELSIDDASALDLGDYAMVVRGGDAAAVRALISSGFVGGAGGITSSLARADATGRTALGYANAGEIGVNSFKGEAVASGDVLVRYTYGGDADLSGDVTLADFARFNVGSEAAPGGATWTHGDFDYSGAVDGVEDFDAFMAGIVATTPGLTAAAAPATNASGAAGASAADLPETPAQDLPEWLAPDSHVNWDAATGTLTVLGSASIVADPGESTAQHVVVDGSAASLTIDPGADANDPAEDAIVHLGTLSISDGGKVTVTSVTRYTGRDRHTLVLHDALAIDGAGRLDLRDNALIV